MARCVFLLLIFAMVAQTSNGTWCVCKDGNDAALQKTLDYACGAGADCNPTKQNGPCFNPNTVRAHCSYAVNSYFQRKGQAQGSCDFAGTATVTTTDPSTSGCAYPTGASGTTAGTSTATTTGGGNNNPLITTPNTGVLGGVNNGMGPNGPGMNTGVPNAGVLNHNNNRLSSSMTLVALALVLFSSCA